MQVRDNNIAELQRPESSKTKVRKVGPYLLMRVIGEGAFGTVYQGLLKSTNRRVAIKQINVEKAKKRDLDRVQLEVGILSLIKHENIIQLIDYKRSSKHMYLVFEHCENNDLEQQIKKYYKGGAMPQQDVRNFFLQIRKGFQVLRKNRVVHRDLKLANLLVTKDFIVKIADFGFAKPLEEDQLLNSYVGSPITMAPEVFEKRDYNEKCDIWSLGIILYQMLYAQNPFLSPDRMTIQALREGLRNKKLEFDPKIPVSDCVRDLLNSMLEKDAEKRMTFEEFFEHPWFIESDPASPSNSELSSEKSIRNAVLAKEVKSFIQHKSDEEIRLTVKYLDRILVYKAVLCVRSIVENRLVGYASLAKKLISLKQAAQSEIEKQLVFAALAILASNLSKAQSTQIDCLVNAVKTRLPSYLVMKSLAVLPTQSEFSRSLPLLINRSQHSITLELKELVKQQSCRQLLQVTSKKGVSEVYLSLLVKYLSSTFDKGLAEVLSQIKEYNTAQCEHIRLTSKVLSRQLLDIINSKSVWAKVENIGRVYNDQEFIRQFNTNHSLLHLDTKQKDKKAPPGESERDQLDVFYDYLITNI